MKKEWVKPELSNLGMKNTKEDTTTINGEPRIIFPCKYCGERFWTLNLRASHQVVCRSNPANQPAAPGEGPDPIPMPGLS